MTVTTDFFGTQTCNWRARLAISVEVMRELSRYSDPQEMYHIFTRRMNQLFPTTRQVTITRRGVERPNVRVTRFNLWKDTANPFLHWDRFPVHSGGLLCDLLYADEPRVIDDLAIDPHDPASAYLAGQRSLLAIPIFEHGHAWHTLVLTREESAAFAPEQIPELVWMTNLFGRATQTLVLSQALREACDAAEADIRTIAELQQSLLPADRPSLPGLDVAAHYRTARRAGGDYYDFFPHPDGSLGVLIADVSGHGTPAAVLMAITHSIAHANGAPTRQAGAFLTHLNAHLAGRYNRGTGTFVTAFYFVVDPAKKAITYASAGHIPPPLVRADGTRIPLNRVQRLPLGIGPADGSYPESVVRFVEGDLVVLFTDGVTEAVDSAGDVFGTDRLYSVLTRSERTAAETLNAVLAAVDAYTGPSAPTDDRTVVVVRRVAKSP